ncbi:lysosomal alpha-glucosidase-like isoform X2 [Gordionus sp. m RMFG-2023]|uniref:lysosomal alpha-glucosidase-like isoform X2 n=1 Tax=Gordionus sp. m RMFG-2023 TaxID=3053472 RepID=UPI0031FE17CC
MYKTNLKIEIIPRSLKIRIKRNSTNFMIFEIDLSTLIYSDQLIQLTLLMNSSLIYGLGEQQANLLRNNKWNKITLFSSDQAPEEQKNLYGVQPFYMVMENDGYSHGIMFLNSNAMEFIIQPYPAITFRSIGGIIDFFLFTGPSPPDVIRQATHFIGRPFMVPYWSLGFHLSRFGYNTLDSMNQTLNRNLALDIPIDVHWSDIDAMEASKDFTYDKKRFRLLPDYIKYLRSLGMRYISIIDAAIMYSPSPSQSVLDDSGYLPFTQGVSSDIFIKNAYNKLFVGRVWPGLTVWPDFFNPSVLKYWGDQFERFETQDEIVLDGVWLDMNEPANFVDGSIVGCDSKNLLNYPPYPMSVNGRNLNYRTICMDSRHNISTHYNLHSLYGLQQSKITHEAIMQRLNVGKRPFIITRSNYLGLGQYAGHWSGDVWSTYQDMALTIPSMINYNLYGIPMTGSDICGFNGNTTSELCTRWHQLGAFYPFSRNHNTDDSYDQDPAAFLNSFPDLVSSTRTIFKIRYSMLPYLYTLFYLANSRGDTVIRALFFDLKNPYWLLIALNKLGEAEGVLYIDDGETLDHTVSPSSLGPYDMLHFKARNQTLRSWILKFDYLPVPNEESSLLISNVTLMGIPRKPKLVQFDSAENIIKRSSYRLDFTYNPLTQVLYIDKVTIVMKYAFVMHWIY